MDNPLALLLQPLLLPVNLLQSLLQPITENTLGQTQESYRTGQAPYGLGEAPSLKENIFVRQKEEETVVPEAQMDAASPTSPYVLVMPSSSERNYKENAEINKKKVSVFGGAKNQRIRSDPDVNLRVDPRRASTFGTAKHLK